MQVRATAKSLRISPRKIGLVAGLVRGRSLADSLVILEHTPKRGAGLLAGVIKSAQANAENNHKLPSKDLVLAQVLVSPGPTTKRYQPVSFGRAHPINKRSSHVTVVVEEMAKEISIPKTAQKSSATKTAKAVSSGQGGKK